MAGGSPILQLQREFSLTYPVGCLHKPNSWSGGGAWFEKIPTHPRKISPDFLQYIVNGQK